MKINISIDNTNLFSSKVETKGANYQSINQNIVDGWNKYDISEAAKLITNGHSFSCANFNGSRKASKWLGQQVFAVDVDDMNSLTPDEAINKITDLFGKPPLLVYK